MSADTETTADVVIMCEFCGFPIEESGQQCPALDDGVCSP